jgi:integrase
VRATEITIARLITTVRWLRRMKHIPRDAATWPEEWKKDIVAHWKGVTKSDRDPEPDRPRYTLAEYRGILSKADFDPRLYLLLRLSVGLRPGQVARARRSDLELPPVDWSVAISRDEQGRDPVDYGVFLVYGAGKKGGASVDLTRGQRLSVEQALTGDGYLAEIDARYQRDEVADYVLFPSGYVVGRVGMLRNKETKLSLSKGADFARTVTGSWIRKNWRVAEARAGIEHQRGRATYGGRRLSVDVGDEMELSPSGLQGLGGWTDIKIPTSIYRERTNKAGRREARPVRARLLGEDE